jgi:hypothetical protein
MKTGRRSLGVEEDIYLAAKLNAYLKLGRCVWVRVRVRVRV